MNSNKCVCDEQELIVKKSCGMPHCNNTWAETVQNPYYIQEECPQHKPVMICGPYLKPCSSCKDNGYSIMSGYGGPTQYFKDGQQYTPDSDKSSKAIDKKLVFF